MVTPPVPTSAPGRPRDRAIDTAVLEETLRQLARDGFVGLSLASIAASAGTSRPAIYRRWPNKEALVVDAVVHLAQVDPPTTTGRPFDDLVVELQHFRHCIELAASLPLAGLMLGDELDEAVRARYREELVVPRRARIRACLDAAVANGNLSSGADLAIAGTFLTGSWYAMAIAGVDPPDDWPQRTAALVWRACGGDPPRAAG